METGDEGQWELPASARSSAREGLMHSVRSLCELKGVKVAEEAALETGRKIEEKAYTAAQVDSRTTTGRRPDAETVQIYARKAGRLVVDAVESIEKGGGASAAKEAGAGAGASTEFLDLCDGNREFVTAQTAREIFAPILSVQDPSAQTVKKIKLSTKSFGVDAAEVAAEAFAACRETLEDLDLSDVIAGRPEAEAMKSLKCLCDSVAGLSLKALDLSDNALGEKGIVACSTALTTQKTLESIAFRNIGCSVAACKAINNLLACKATLKKLHLYNNMSDDEGAFAIANLIESTPNIEDFMMVSSRVKQEGGQRLAQVLTGKPLVSLDLHDNILGAETAQALAQTLKDQPRLKHLNLSEACLEDEGAIFVCQGLFQNCPELETVSLAANDISDNAVNALAQGLAGKPKLRAVSLEENYDIGEEAQQWLQAQLPNVAIRFEEEDEELDVNFGKMKI